MSKSTQSIFGNTISSYSRAVAIEHGFLIDVSEIAKERGFKFPVAITAAVESDINNIPPSKDYQDYEGRLWDVLHMLYMNIQSSESTSIINYSLIMHVGRKSYYYLKAKVSGGDNGEPVITIMKPSES